MNEKQDRQVYCNGWYLRAQNGEKVTQCRRDDARLVE